MSETPETIAPSSSEARKKIRSLLPKYMFQPQPLRGWIGILMIPFYLLSAWIILHFNPSWYCCLFLSIGIGQLVTSWGFLAHEALHGAIFSNKFGQHFLGYLGYTPMLISPLTWRFWHCQCHHGFTNCPGQDPDLVSIKEYASGPVPRFFSAFIPGTHHWLGFIGLFCLFTLQGQYALWFFGLDRKLEKQFNFNRLRAKVETILMFVFWIGLGTSIGLKNSFYIIILPMAITNFVNISYISAQHMLLPSSDKLENPFSNTISVKTNPILNFLHLQFGYHLEHHLFPTMSHRYAHHVSHILRNHYSEHYIYVPYLKALWLVLKTPRIYLDRQTLTSPISGQRVPIESIKQKLRRMSV